MAERGLARPFRLLWTAEQHAFDGRLRLRSATPMAPGLGPAQSAGHDMGSVQPLDENLSVADADNHSLNKRKIGARHGLNLGRSRMRERRKSGSVRGAGSNLRPYSTVYNGMISPRDSWMMPPPCNEMIPPGAPRLLALEVFSPYSGSGQAVLDCLPRARRRLSPVSSMRWALWTRRSRMASA